MLLVVDVGNTQTHFGSVREGAIVIGDVRLPSATREALRVRFDYEEARIQNFPMKFACPSVVLRQEETNSGATESAQPWGDAVAQS